MGFEEIHPRGLFYDFEEASPQNYLLEILVPAVCFCSSRTQSLEILIRDFPRVFFPRDTTLEELITRGEILLLEKV